MLERLRYRWPYILEDEAQDSSRLQEEILQTLSGPDGNWVRVGDPNQAIYETFTTANPDTCAILPPSPGVNRRSLANSGRSTQSIIDLANHLVEWTRQAHPNPALRGALQAPPLIEPTPPGDPQPNPPDDPGAIHLIRANTRLRGDSGGGRLAGALAARASGGDRRSSGAAQPAWLRAGR